MDSLKLGLLNIKMNIKNAQELKISFLITVIGMFINNIAFLVCWYYFGKTVGNLNGWDALDVFGLYGYNGLAYELVMTSCYGFMKLPTYIASGNLDKYLVTPKSTIVKIATSTIEISALGDLLFGLVCFMIYAIGSGFTIVQYLLSIVVVLLASVVFFAFLLICMSLSFYLMEDENISMSLYGVFLSNSMYHGGAYTGLLRVIFIFIIPSLLVAALPVEIIKNVSIYNLIIMIIMTIVWLTFAIMFFKKSIKRYESNNFFGFSG